MKYQSDLINDKISRKATQKYMEWLKKKKPVKLDEVVQSIHNQVFAKVDCLECANCCKTTSPIFYPKDVERAAKALKIKAAFFEQEYLRVDEEGDYVLQQSPCAFLREDNKCSIYDNRPTACREYPHTNRKNFVQITELTYKNTLVCPAVVRIVKGLQEKFPVPLV
jgi:uncharacterized protein